MENGSGETKKEEVPTGPAANDLDPTEAGAAEGPGAADKKKKKKKKPTKEPVKDEKKKEPPSKGPSKKLLAAKAEAIRKIKEEEERLLREEEEKNRLLDESENKRLEKLKEEQEKKERKKLKEKEKKERLRAEGKLLTPKQRLERQRAQAMLEALKAQGVDVPEVGEKKARPGTRIRNRKGQVQTQKSEEDQDPSSLNNESTDGVVAQDQEGQGSEEQPIEDPTQEDKEVIDVKDAWDEGSDDEEETSDPSGKDEPKTKNVDPTVAAGESPSTEEDNNSDGTPEDSDQSSTNDDDDEEDEPEHKTDAETKRDKALARIKKRREENEKARSVKKLRCPVVCVLGHVDTGKTKILDKLRRTHVQDGEVGGITQQIGATNVPIDAIKEQSKLIKNFTELDIKIPGLLIIDTPGHESFSNLRSRGTSLCDIAILVVDIMHGLEQQTLESINLLKAKKTPFVVALNKIDRLYGWQSSSSGRKDIRDILKTQPKHTMDEFESKSKEIIVQFAEQGLNAALFFENPDIKTYISMIPTSAVTGEGMGNLMALIVEFSQSMLTKRLMYSAELQGIVLEVKAISGLGTTIDVILLNGTLREGDTLIVAGTDGPIVTQIRSLLTPQPMKELRVKNTYVEFKEISGAIGVKVAGKDLEKAIAGLNLLVAHHPDEIEICKEEVARELRTALSSIRLQERGVYVQASTLGSLEALLELLRTSDIPYAGVRIGPVVKKDVMKASIMLEHDKTFAVILAFDVKIERDAQELADNLGVKIYQADIIYHLTDAFTKFRDELKEKKRDEFKHIAVFPCKIKILPQFIFNTRDPIVVGVSVEAGVIREGTPLCVPSKDFVGIGIVTSIELNHKTIESARKGQDVCIKIEPLPGESPKLLGRHFEESDLIVSKISRESIDACKDYFRDDLQKSDWQLMVELKKLFQIL